MSIDVHGTCDMQRTKVAIQGQSQSLFQIVNESTMNQDVDSGGESWRVTQSNHSHSFPRKKGLTIERGTTGGRDADKPSAILPARYRRAGKALPVTVAVVSIVVLFSLVAVALVVFLFTRGDGLFLTRGLSSTDEGPNAEEPGLAGSPQSLVRKMIESEPTFIVELSGFELSPNGDFVWGKDKIAMKSFGWDISNGRLYEKYPDVLFFANLQNVAVGHDPSVGESMIQFPYNTPQSSRVRIDALSWTPMLGQAAGDDMAAIYASEQRTLVVYADGHRFEKEHEPISTELDVRWSSDLKSRYYFDAGKIYRFDEVTSMREVVYETSLEPPYKSDLAPDAGSAVIANGFHVELIDLKSGRQVGTSPIRVHRAIRQVELAPSGNSVAVLLRQRSPENDLPGNVEVYDLRKGVPEHLACLPVFAMQISMHRDGTHLAAFSAGEGLGKCSYWDLGFGEDFKRIDFASIAAFDDPARDTQSVATDDSNIAAVVLDGVDSFPRIGTRQSESPKFPFKLGKIRASADFSLFAVQAEHYLAGELATWNAADSQIVRLGAQRSNLLGTLRLSQDGQRLSCGGDVFDSTTGQVDVAIGVAEDNPGVPYFESDNLFASDGASILGVRYGQCVLWHLSDNRMVTRGAFTEVESDFLFYFDATSDLSTAYAADQEGRIIRLDVARGRPTTIREKGEACSDIDFLADEELVTIVSASGSLDVIRLDSGEVRVAPGIDGWKYQDLQLARNGTRALASLVRVEALKNKRCLVVLDLTQAEIEVLGVLDIPQDELLFEDRTPMAVSADGSRVAFGSAGQQIVVFEIE